MPKSIAIKTNNLKDISYILNELENSKIDNVYFSCKKFKNYTNIIIHYKGNAISIYLSFLSRVLSYLVLDLYENSIIKKTIETEYFYFSYSEQKEILNLCINALNYDDLLKRYEFIENSFFNYLSDNKIINLNGFINFRLTNYLKHLDSIVDMSVNKFIISKEYSEFVNLLRSYIFTSKSTPRIHTFNL